MKTATLNLFSTAIEIDGRTVVCARQTPRGWYWFSNIGRVGRGKFASKEAALRAAARTIGFTITDVIQDRT